MKTLTDVMNSLPKERRAKVEAHAETLIAEEMTLQDLRKASTETRPVFQSSARFDRKIAPGEETA